MTELHNFIPLFPDFQSDDIQTVLHTLQEFFSNESIKEKEKIALGEYFRHQRYNARLFMFTDRLFCIHVPGTGKSCLQIAVDLQVIMSNGVFTHAYISTTDTLVQTMQIQALCKCTTGFLEVNAMGKRREGPNREFKKMFTIMSHRDLFNKITDRTTSRVIGKRREELNQMFSGTILQIDEITKIIPASLTNKSSDQIESKSQYRIDPQIKRLKDITDINDESIINSELQYVQFWRLVHSVDIFKFMGLTGTPIINHPSEFFMLANLFLPLNQQYDVAEISNRIFSLSIEDFRPLNGIISYVGTSPSISKAEKLGVIIPNVYEIEESKNIQSQFKLCMTELYANQAEKLFSKRLETSADISNQIIQCYVGPNGEMGAGPEVIDKSTREQVIDERNLNIILRNDIQVMECAAILEEIAYREKMKFQNNIDSDGPGCSYIYNHLTNSVYPIAKIIFKKYGFEVYSYEQLNQINNSAKSSFCGSDSANISFLKPSTHRPRIVFIDSRITKVGVSEQILEIMGSKENVRGRCIQCIAASHKFEMGVNIGNIEEMYRISPEWNEARYNQSRDRIFREDSGDHLKEYYSQKYNIPISEIVPIVKLKDICSYSRYFFIHQSNIGRFSSDESTIFGETKSPIFADETYHIDTRQMISNPGDLITSPMSMQAIGQQPYRRFLSSKIAHYIGFYRDAVQSQYLFNFFEEGENLSQKVEMYFEKELLHDQENYNRSEYYLIFTYAGILFSKQCGPDLFNDRGEISEHEKVLFISTIANANAKQIYRPNKKQWYSNQYCVVTKTDIIQMYPVELLVLSSSYDQYTTMEKKSFSDHHVMRFVKQIAVDCIANLDRNILPSDYDGTAICDYQSCEYECSSGPKKDSTVIWDNFEILYSDKIITEYKDQIFGYFSALNEVSFVEIYSYFEANRTDYREYFLNKAIIDVVTEKKPIIDRFGFICFICATETKLFLKRDIADFKTDALHFSNTNSLTGFISNRSLAFEKVTSDEELLQEIESIDPDSILEDIFEKLELIEKKIDQFNAFIYRSRLLERSYVRRLYTKYNRENPDFNDEFREIKIDPLLTAIFKTYVQKIPTSTGEIYIHYYPTKWSNRTSQNSIKRIANPTSFRIITDVYNPVWKNANIEQKAEYLDIIKQKIKDEMKSEVLIKTVSGSEITIPYFMIKDLDPKNTGDNLKIYKLVNKNGKGSGRSIATIKTEVIDEVVRDIRGKIDISVYPNLIELFNKYDTAAKIKKTKEIKIAFIEIFNSLGLVN